jgi:hypothetical protein
MGLWLWSLGLKSRSVPSSIEFAHNAYVCAHMGLEGRRLCGIPSHVTTICGKLAFEFKSVFIPFYNIPRF